MFYIFRNFVTIMIEVICCKFFFDSLWNTNNRKHPYIVPCFLSVILYVTAAIFENHFSYKEIIIITISKVLLFIIVAMAGKLFGRKDRVFFSDSAWITFLFLPACTICIMTALLSDIPYIGGKKGGNLVWVASVGFLGIYILVYYLIEEIAIRDKKIYKQKMFETGTGKQHGLYMARRNSDEKQREILHEYKNKMECIQSLYVLGQNKELGRYLSEITGEVMHDIDYFDTGHAIINAVINAKYHEAQSKDIMMICMLGDMSNVRMGSQDIVLILSNLLNNAIEACEKCEGKKSIKVKMLQEADSLIIAVKNTYNGLLNMEEGDLKTTKEESGLHGFGIKNLVKSLGKYDAFHAICYDDNVFLFSIVIPQ